MSSATGRRTGPPAEVSEGSGDGAEVLAVVGAENFGAPVETSGRSRGPARTAVHRRLSARLWPRQRSSGGTVEYLPEPVVGLDGQLHPTGC